MPFILLHQNKCFWNKIELMLEKKASQYVRDQENMMDGTKSHIPCQWISTVSYWQYVAEHCHETKLWQNLNSCKKKSMYHFFFPIKPSKLNSEKSDRKLIKRILQSLGIWTFYTTNIKMMFEQNLNTLY